MRNIILTLNVLILILIFGNIETSALLNQYVMNGSSRCLIKNAKYSNEYLLSSRHDYELFYDEFNTYYKRKVFTNKIDSTLVKSLKQIVWTLDPIKKETDTFFLTNNLYKDEHLCATHRHLEMFKLRRRIALITMDRNILRNSDKCWWRFVPVRVNNNNSESNFYLIQNVHYNESLYAASYFFKSAITNARNVYTWHKKPDSSQFAWFVNCF